MCDGFVDASPARTIEPQTVQEVPWFVTKRSLIIELRGQIGPTAPVNLQSIERQLIGRQFQHLHLEIDSTGGDVLEATNIHRVFRSLPVPVSARVVGCCLSAAVDILLSASLRIATFDAEILLHQASYARDQLPERLNASALADWLGRLQATDARFARLLHLRTGTAEAWISEEIGTEDSLDLGTAIEHGIIHGIEGTGDLNPRWPAVARDAVSQGFALPARVMSTNFFEACRTFGLIEELKAA